MALPVFCVYERLSCQPKNHEPCMALSMTTASAKGMISSIASTLARMRQECGHLG